MVNISEKIRGGLFGLLVGDALGVPYEFRPKSKIPSRNKIDMVPPVGYDRAHAWVQPGTWSDDGSQALCLLDSLLECGELSLDDFSSRLIRWYDKGLWTPDGKMFDVGNQTRDAIQRLKHGDPPTRAGFVHPNGKGNGALMRVLPLTLWHIGSDLELVEAAHRQSLPTHGHITNQICCALYCLWARRLLEGQDTETAYNLAVSSLRKHYGEDSEYRRDLEATVRPDDAPHSDGGGYVVSTLHCARFVLREKTYEDVVKSAIQYGNDTDTNAAVAGGLAGIRDGINGIPKKWLDMLNGKNMVDKLLIPLLQRRHAK